MSESETPEPQETVPPPVPAVKKSKKHFVAVRKVPADAPAPPGGHFTKGRPLGIYEYRDADGDLAGLMYDYISSTSNLPQQLSVAWGEHTSSTRISEGRYEHKVEAQWRWMWFPAQRPLWNLEQILDNPEAEIAVMADEHSAETVQTLLPDYVATTWAGTIKHIEETDWTPLRNRRAVVWLPSGSERYKVVDTDPLAGQVMPLRLQRWFKAAVLLAEILGRLNCTVRFVVFKPGDKPDGWCMREARAGGMGKKDLENVLLLDTHTFSAATADFIADIIEGKNTKRILAPDPASPGNVDDKEWQRDLLRDRDNNAVLPELANVRLVMAQHSLWRGCVAMDGFSHRIMKREPPPFAGGAVGEWADGDDIEAHVWLTMNMGMLRVKTTDVAKAVIAIANQNSFHPLQDFLRDCKALWLKDKKKRLDTWTQTYLGASAQLTGEETAAELAKADKLNAYCSLVGKVCLLGAVKRAFHPGCQFDYVLILEGEQGKGKSSAIGILGGEFAMDSPLDFHSRDSVEALQGKWIVELSELDSFSKAEVTTSKSFLPRKTDRFRLPYGKRSADFARSCIFAGTTNEGEYFRDRTGNRRYHPMYCWAIDRVGLARDRMLLLGEAVVRMEQGEQVFPSPEQELELIVPEQQKRMVNDPWLELIGEWLMLKLGQQVTMAQILKDCLKIDPGKMDEGRMSSRVGHLMRELGWEKGPDLGSHKPKHERRYYEKKGSAR